MSNKRYIVHLFQKIVIYEIKKTNFNFSFRIKIVPLRKI